MNDIVTAEQIRAQGRREPGSQAAGIEQSRAVAEVQAAVTVAQARPRDESVAVQKAVSSCRQMAVAEVAFFRFPRGGQTVSGETIHFATELARCWGNISYGIMELARDDQRHISEMLAFAWDLETNAQSRMTFLVPHLRDKRGGPEILIDMRDIYENNANNGARRLRECIFRVLPPHLKEAAKKTCLETLQKGEGDKPLPVRIADAVAAFEAIGISIDRIEAKLGKRTVWTAVDVAQLLVSYRSINRREITADEEFPRTGAEETAAAARAIVEKGKAKPKGEPVDEVVQEGRDDSQHGDQHTDDDGSDQSPAAIKAREFIKRAEACQSKAELSALEDEAEPHLKFMEGDLPVWVSASFHAADKRLSQNGGLL